MRLVCAGVFGAWHLKLTEENRLRAFQERALRRIFGPKRGMGSGNNRRLDKTA
jgi:hypothetical protein